MTPRRGREKSLSITGSEVYGELKTQMLICKLNDVLTVNRYVLSSNATEKFASYMVLVSGYKFPPTQVQSNTVPQRFINVNTAYLAGNTICC